MRKCKLKFALAAALGFAAATANAELVVIVNLAFAGNISSKSIQDIYLGNNRTLKPIDQSKNSADRKAFLMAVLAMSESEFNRHWSKRIFSGKGSPPNHLSSAEAVLLFVADNQNAIGYVDASLVTDDSVKVALRID